MPGTPRSAFDLVGIPLTLATVLGAFVVFTSILAFLTRWQTTFNFRLREDLVVILRQRLYQAIVNTDWLTFSRTRSSDFTHALTSELDRVGNATALLLQMVTNAILVSVYVLFALRISAVMTVTVFAAGLILALVLRRMTGKSREIGEEISAADGGLYSAAIEHLSGMKTVKSYGVEERNAQIFSKLSEQVARVYTKSMSNYAGAAFFFTVGSAVVLSSMLYVASEFLQTTAAGLLLLLFLFNRMIPLFNSVQRGYQQYLNELPAFARVMELQDRCEAAAEPVTTASRALVFREILRFEGVSLLLRRRGGNRSGTRPRPDHRGGQDHGDRGSLRCR